MTDSRRTELSTKIENGDVCRDLSLSVWVKGVLAYYFSIVMAISIIREILSE
jgi:hypothetical protein